MTDRSLQASEQLAASGIDAEVIDLRWLRPLDFEAVEPACPRLVAYSWSRNRCTPEAGVPRSSRTWRWTACNCSLPPRAVGLPDDLLISYSPPLEDEIIPSVDAIASAAEALMA